MGQQRLVGVRGASSGWRMWAPRLGSFGALLVGLAAAAPLSGCAAGGAANSERYPEKKRPEPLRSASDGQIMGADQISPEDRLEASPTNQHGAAVSPHAEQPAAEAHERLEYEQCLEANKAEAGAGGKPAKKPVCTPPEGTPQP
jgi:hypothetical protein